MSNNGNGLAQARRQRDEAQERFEITFDANPAPSMIVRLEDAQVVATNLGFHEVSGRGNDQVKDHSVRDLGLFSDKEVFERILGILREGESTTKETLTMVSRTLGERTMLVSAQPIRLEDDTCGIFTFADVTELKQAEEAARNGEQKFSQAFHLAPISATISTLGKGETFLDTNEAFLRLTGYSREEIIGKDVFSLGMWSSVADQRKLQAAQKDRLGFHELELHLKHKDGAHYDVLLSAEVIRLNGHEGYLKMFYDITDRKKSEKQMHQAIQSLMNDATWFSSGFIARLNHIRAGGDGESFEQVVLSRRERQVLECIAAGWDNKRISDELKLKLQTVRNYITNLYGKLGVHTRAEAVVWARERGIQGR